MSERARNVAVGLTVIGALALLAGMIVLFAGVPQWFQGGYRVRMLFDATHDAHTGDPVNLRGMRVGRVTDIYFTDGNPATGVTIVARVDGNIDLPAGTQAYIFTKGIAGGAYLELKPEGPAKINPKTGKYYDCLPKDGSVVLQGRHQGTELLPQDLMRDLRSAMDNLSQLAKNLNDMIAPPTPSPVPSTGTGPASQPAAPAGLRGTLDKLDQALTAVIAVLGNTENQANIQKGLAGLVQAAQGTDQAMAAIKAFAEQANQTVKELSKPAASTLEHFDELTRSLINTADKVSQAVAALNQAVDKINAGEGTVGKLVNDPKLYNDLVDATRQMVELMKEMRVLLEKWKQQGLMLKLK